jgi:hypothetical protein
LQDFSAAVVWNQTTELPVSVSEVVKGAAAECVAKTRAVGCAVSVLHALRLTTRRISIWGEMHLETISNRTLDNIAVTTHSKHAI